MPGDKLCNLKHIFPNFSFAIVPGYIPAQQADNAIPLIHTKIGLHVSGNQLLGNVAHRILPQFLIRHIPLTGFKVIDFHDQHDKKMIIQIHPFQSR